MTDAHGPIARGYARAAERWKHRALEAEARLAEVETERDSAVLLRDEWNARAGVAFARAEAAEARLARPAEVTGLCDEHADYGACPDSCREGDRPAADHIGIFDGPPLREGGNRD